ncbi:MAG: hypothetical protein DSY47_05595 [Hydrogenothermus sp.]|nr:MAG: hypothetical protein DSY47_05595 [Hydrogenothermus sp.]
MDEKQLKIEKKKLLIEQAKVIEGQRRTLVLVIIALGGAISTLILNFNSYQNKDLVLTFIGLSLFLLALVSFISIKLWFELEQIKKRTIK